MVQIAISQAAFDAIAATMQLGSVGFENQTNERGEKLIWLDHAVVARLRALRGPGELGAQPDTATDWGPIWDINDFRALR